MSMRKSPPTELTQMYILRIALRFYESLFDKGIVGEGGAEAEATGEALQRKAQDSVG